MRVYVGSRQVAQYPNNQSRLFRAAMTDLLKAVSVHPAAKLIKRLQFARETRDWKDRVGVTEIIYITGPNLSVHAGRRRAPSAVPSAHDASCGE